MDGSNHDGNSSDDSSIEHAAIQNNTMKSSSSTTTNDATALLISASDKPGMQNIDRNRINAILLRESSDSAFMKRQRRLDEKSDERIKEMKKRLRDKDITTDNDWRKALLHSTIDPLLKSYRSKRRSHSTCAVIDMDGFFISCHILSNPHLATVPACVGSTSMISTSNYIARRYGVRAAMPGYLGSMLVKELSVVDVCPE